MSAGPWTYFFYYSCSYDDWYYCYCLIPHSLTCCVEIYIFGHLFSSLLLNVIVIGYCHIYYHAHVCFFLFDYYIWFILRYMSMCYHLGIPQYCYLLFLSYCLWFVLIPFCIHMSRCTWAAT